MAEPRKQEVDAVAQHVLKHPAVAAAASARTTRNQKTKSTESDEKKGSNEPDHDRTADKSVDKEKSEERAKKPGSKRKAQPSQAKSSRRHRMTMDSSEDKEKGTKSTDDAAKAPKEDNFKEAKLEKPVDKKHGGRGRPQVREKMKLGDIVNNDANTWKVVKLLGSGGFGDVYKVYKEGDKNGKEFAMKTEVIDGNKRLMRLKVEVMVLVQCSEAPPDRRHHFVELVDKGKAPQFKFLVMSLVGPSLEDVRKTYLMRNFSKSTAMLCSIQTLEATSDLHGIGYIHRDIKPANFAVGLADNEGLIYMLDFGISRRHIDSVTGKPKAPRVQVKFLGTMRFASRACHMFRDQGRKDDLESWLFMVFDLFDDKDGLPWKRASDKHQVLPLKQKFFKQPRGTPYRHTPQEMTRLVAYIDQLAYECAPDYLYIIDGLKNIAAENKIPLDKKPDWAGRLKKVGSSESADTKNTTESSSDNRKTGSDSEGTEEHKKESKRAHWNISKLLGSLRHRDKKGAASKADGLASQGPMSVTKKSQRKAKATASSRRDKDAASKN